MRNKLFIFLFILCVGIAKLSAAELSGTYSKDFTVTTDFNTVSAGKTLRVKKKSTFVMTDAIVNGNIIVEKGSKLIAKKDGEGYLVFGEGTHVEGIDLYYKVRCYENLMFTRKFPMTLDEIWKSGNRELIDWVSHIEFCYSSSLKGWVSINETRYLNLFNENLYENYVEISRENAPERLPPPGSTTIDEDPKAYAIGGTYTKNYTVETTDNTVVQGDTLRIKNKSTFVITDLRVIGNIIVEKGSSLVAAKDGEGYLKLENGSHVEGVDLYYKVRVSDTLVFTRKLPVSIDEIWKLNDKGIVDLFTYTSFHYSSTLKGWVPENELRFMNPFNENFFDDYDIVLTKFGSQEIEHECRSLIVKNKAKVVLLPLSDPGVRGVRINGSIIVEKGSSLLGTGPDGLKLELKKGVTVQGLSLYVIYDNDYVPVESLLPELWNQGEFKTRNSGIIYYEPELNGWVFEQGIYNNSVTENFKKKLENLPKTPK